MGYREVLIKNYIEHSKKVEQIDDALQELCLMEMNHLLVDKRYTEAKDYINKFYKNCVNADGQNISLTKEELLSKVNRLIKTL